MSFTIFYNEKTPFYAIKKGNSKSRKIDIFPMAVNPWFWSKNRHFFQVLFLGNISKENVFYDILERKNSFLGYKNHKLIRSKNSHFYKGVNSCFLCKNEHYTNLCFQAIQAMIMSFRIFQNDKTPFQAIKTRSSKSQKIGIF